ncbi:cytochrome P450 [Trifolium medium]|uniref:Cytochrome P450 n=1 Tax=Trifolium medium TaxID=97028 RepID=A0A392Q871_9FABA|nr:cytochrome P450 [Trifolium medium]
MQQQPMHGQQPSSNAQQQLSHALQQIHAQQMQSDSTGQQWRHPPPGYVKCNVDASFYNTPEATGWGWCARDHQGRFIIAGTNMMYAKLNRIEGETMAIKEAMEEMIQRVYPMSFLKVTPKL